MKKIIVLVICLLFSSPACGTIYRWIDAAGVKHFTNRENDIPARYRDKSMAIFAEQPDTGVAPQNVITPQSKPDPQLMTPAPQANPEGQRESKQPEVAPGFPNNQPKPARKRIQHSSE